MHRLVIAISWCLMLSLGTGCVIKTHVPPGQIKKQGAPGQMKKR